MKRDLEGIQSCFLLRSEFIDSTQENRFGFFATVVGYRQKCKDRDGRWELSVLQPPSHHGFKDAQYLYRSIESTYHFIRTKFVRWNCANCYLELRRSERRCGHASPNQSFIRHGNRHIDHLTESWQLRVGAIHDRANGIRSSQQGALIGIDKQLCSMSILPTHYKYRYPQCSDRTDCLDPARPIGFRELKVISQYDDVDYAKKHQKCEREVGIFHAHAKNCSKGILA